jgi:FlaG/FlaF family flagellin (archaellin)
MKGISTILAMILIVIIVVALIGLTYTFAVGLFSTTSGTVTEQTQQFAQTSQKLVSIESASCKVAGSPATATYKFTLRNKGTSDILGTELAGFVDGERVAVTFVALPKQTVGSEITFTTTSANLITLTQHTLKVSAPSVPAEYDVTCS